ncbi:MAG: adenylate/guanylate cyclase domain-containing protein [Gammaproteobacteria bacterium]|nr:adenylate/guanylate cyclase domain-containing protein [Gammaproteobacteria bacterium]
METLEKHHDIEAVIALFLLAMILEYQEAFSLIEDETLSYRQLVRTYYGVPEQVAPTEDVVIVYTDEAFYSEYDQYPLTRRDLSRILDNLFRMGAKVIGVDMILDFKSAYGEDPSLEFALKESGNVLLVSQASFDEDGDFEQINTAIPRFAENARSGYSNVSSNSAISQSIVRVRLYPEIVEQEDHWPFAYEAVSMLLEQKLSYRDGVVRVGDRAVRLDQFNDLYIDFPLLPGSSTGTLKLHEVIGLSAIDVLFIDDEEEMEDLSYLVKDKIVLIGEVAEVAHDEFETPVGNVFGVEIIANTISTILRNAPLQAASIQAEIFLALIVMLALLATTRLTGPMPRNLTNLGIITLFVAFVSYMHARSGTVYSMTYTMLAAILSVVVIETRFYLAEMAQKKQIRTMFGQYLSPTVVADLVKDPEKLALGGEEREMTAYFSDIQGFSSFSEAMTPSELVQMLNEYLTEMCNIIVGEAGTIDKFEGDAIIAFWGAPGAQADHALRACHASIDMNKALVPLRKHFIEAGWPEIRVRMGVNTGRMVVGNMGSAQRMNYTMMGDAVNLAARLEGANKAYGSDIMISENTHRLVSGDVDVRELDTIRVVGKSEAVTVYQLLERKNQTQADLSELVEAYEKALAAYKERDFARARGLFEACLVIDSEDGPSRTYQARCAGYMATPPASDWDGVFTLMDKG